MQPDRPKHQDRVQATQWFAWDPAPWDHPFLTPANLKAFRTFSEGFFARLEEQLAGQPAALRGRRFRFAFTGNIANDLYQRLRGLSAHGLTPDLVQHPQDKFVMSDPRWEEFDGVAPESLDDLDAVNETVFTHGKVHKVTGRIRHPGQISDWQKRLKKLRKTYRPEDLDRWPEFFCLLPMFKCLRGYDAVLGTQVPFVPYLANMPYLLTQSGADIWIAASRGDAYGALHRAAYRNCAAFLVSNPWAIAHARRLGLTNVVYLPAVIAESIYKPGPPVCRADWQQRSGGSFFVLSTSRMHEGDKGSSLGLKGFARFARQAPGARLVLVEWGQEKELARKVLAAEGVLDRVIFLPMSGKRRLMAYLQSAHCLLDQFVLRQLGSTTREALACGLPVVVSIDVALFDAYFDGALPVLNAETDEDIAAALQRLHDEEDTRRAISASSRQWFLDNMSGARWASRYRQILTACALGLEFDFSDPPLQKPLSETERDYLRSGLEHAPAHP